MIPISVITVNLNNAAGLKRTIQSLLTQTFTNFEFIVIDGGSTDGSVQLIERIAPRITYWVSEADNGIYHAMNKGIQQAQGAYCLFLNSGDWLTGPAILQELGTMNLQADIVSGDIYYYDEALQSIKWHIPSPERVTARTFFLGTLPHQATLIKRSLFTRIGLYNEQLKITSDWLFFLEAIVVHRCTYQHFQGTIAYFNMDGISCNPDTERLPRREQLTILQERYPLFLPDYEYLHQLEIQSTHWFASQEYRVYRFLKRIGLIRIGVFGRRVKRAICRLAQS